MAQYKEKSLIGYSIGTFLIKYGDKDLVDDFFRLIHK